MRSRRLVLFAVLICLPAVLIIGTGAVLIVRYVPKAIRGEPSRIGREYREVAEKIISSSDASVRHITRGKGWRRSGLVCGCSWGYVNQGAQTLVWVLSKDSGCRGKQIDTIRPFPYSAVFYGGGAVVAFTLISLSVFATMALVGFMRERDDFLAAVAHDLTTPLVGMRMMIGRNADEARLLNERLLLIVGNIREFLRLGGHRRKPTPRRFDIVAACREAYSLFAADYEDSEGGAVNIDSQPRFVYADETMTMQILWNLWGNDLKYAAPYGKVAIRFRQERGMVCVDFVDEGPGMTPRQMRRAFDRYYRAKTVQVTGKGGFGIGLCTARDFARAMGGELSVAANDPKGCVFTLTLHHG